MTAQALATLLQARRSGAGWSAKCPAHPDRSPSLSIREGDGGRILVHCFAGCSIDAVLSALGLRRCDLFAGPPPTPAQVAAQRAALEAKQAKARTERSARQDAIRKVERLQAIVNELGGQLAQHPDGGVLVNRFHRTCNRLHAAEMILDSFYL